MEFHVDAGVPITECLGKNCPAPSNVLVKDFARWYFQSRREQLGPRPSIKSVKDIPKKFSLASTKSRGQILAMN
jgi:hypothetical protein